MLLYHLRRGNYKTLRVRIVPPEGAVEVSAPRLLPRFLIDAFVESHRAWIESQRERLTRTVLDSIHLWGEAFQPRVSSPGRVPRVVVDRSTREITLRVPASWTRHQQQRAWKRWEAAQLAERLRVLLPLWAERTGLSVDRWTVKHLRSRWGSCQPATGRLVFNARLAALPPVCLESVVVHELAHLIEPTHNARFHALVDRWFPETKTARIHLKNGVVNEFAFGIGASADQASTTGPETAL